MTTGTFANERKALEQCFSQKWAGETDIQWENAEFSTDGIDEYVQVNLLPAERLQTTISSTGAMRGSGIFQVSVFVRENIGTARLEALCDKVREAMQRRNLGGFVFTYASSRNYLDADEGWYGAAVSTVYDVDEVFTVPSDDISLTL